MARYATADETARVFSLLDSGGWWTRWDLGRSAGVCFSHVDSALKAISFRKGFEIARSGSPVEYELRRV